MMNVGIAEILGQILADPSRKASISIPVTKEPHWFVFNATNWSSQVILSKQLALSKSSPWALSQMEIKK